jgi:hypothetical protein
MKLKIFTTIFALFGLVGCISTYPDHPKHNLVPMEKTIDQTLYYSITDFPDFIPGREGGGLGGRKGIVDYINNNSPFKKAQELRPGNDGLVDITNKTHYVNIKIEWNSPSTVSKVFLALSTLTATILPAWSHEDGYDFKYILYRNGKEVKQYRYSLKRSYYQQLFLGLFYWMNNNYFTEEEVFQKITESFFTEADKNLREESKK